MLFFMKIISIILIIFVIPLHNIFSQEKVLTKEGKEVILYNDGTWKYSDFENKNKSSDFRKFPWGSLRSHIEFTRNLAL